MLQPFELLSYPQTIALRSICRLRPWRAGLLVIASFSFGFAQQHTDAGTRPGTDKSSVSHISNPVAQGITQEQATALLDEMRNLRQLLEELKVQAQRGPMQGAAQAKARINVDKAWHALGRNDAPVTVVEFTDLQCPYCKRSHAETFQKIKEAYIDTGKVRFVSLDLPLGIHPYAFKAAEAVRCAGAQGKFWELRNALLAKSVVLSEETIGASSEALGLEMTEFRTCLASERFKSEVDQDLATAAELQVRGTPTFLVARTTQQALEGTRISGAVPFSLLQGKIDEILKEAPQSARAE